MYDRHDMNSDYRDIEEMVLAAGDYLEVADDLRGDTLDKARHATRQNTRRLRISIMAAAVVCCAFFVGQVRSRLLSSPIMTGIMSDSTTADGAGSRNARPTGVDPSSEHVDAFAGKRKRHASIIANPFMQR